MIYKYFRHPHDECLTSYKFDFHSIFIYLITLLNLPLMVYPHLIMMMLFQTYFSHSFCENNIKFLISFWITIFKEE